MRGRRLIVLSALLLALLLGGSAGALFLVARPTDEPSLPSAREFAVLFERVFVERPLRISDRDQRLLSEALSAAAGRPVSAACRDEIAWEFVRLRQHRDIAGYVRFLDGKPDDIAAFAPEICRQAIRYMRGKDVPSAECMRNMMLHEQPCRMLRRNLVAVLNVIAHEAAHLAGEANEARAQCLGMRLISDVAVVLLDIDRRTAVELSLAFYYQQYGRFGDSEYVSAWCRAPFWRKGMSGWAVLYDDELSRMPPPPDRPALKRSDHASDELILSGL